MAALPRLKLKYEGLDAYLAKLRPENLYAEPWSAFMRQARQLTDTRLHTRVPMGESHRLEDSIKSTADVARVPLWVTFEAGAKRVGVNGSFNYGQALQSYRKPGYRYRHGVNAGKRTRRWLSGTVSSIRKEVAAMLAKAATEIERHWATRG